VAVEVTPEARERIRRNLIAAGYFAEPGQKEAPEVQSSSATPRERVATAEAV